VCLATGSLVRVAELGDVRRRLELVHGKLAAELAPQPAGSSFGVVTRGGSAVAIGTAFSVEVPRTGGPVVTRVLHGTVVVRSRAGNERRVTAHRALTMDGEPRVLPAAEEARERTLVDQTSRVDAAITRPVPSTSPAPVVPVVAARHEEDARPDEPLLRSHAQDPRAAPHAPGVRAPRVQVQPALTARVARPRARSRTHDTRRAVVEDLGLSSASQLLSQAREARARGETESACDAYRALLARHQGSPEAHAARVPYGELLLAAGSPRAAQQQFARYLERTGPLTEEARFGQLRALRALGDSGAERAALESFLRSYPASPLLGALEARARSLGAR
jgi:hypothetical protein